MSTDHRAWRRLVEERQRLPGNYIICERSSLRQARKMAVPGDTISVHPDELDDPPTLYAVEAGGELRELVPRELDA